MTGSGSTPDVSFVVIAHNEEATIVSCLSAISSQTGARSFEILVVDDGSHDETAALVKQFGADRPGTVTLLQHTLNRGRGAARQTGLKAARGELIAMVDADIVLPGDWLQRCAAALVADGVDAVGGIALPDGDVSYLHRQFGLLPRIVPPTVPVSGCNGLYKRGVFETVSVDPSLAEGEDVALNRAMEGAGLIARTLSDVTVEHRESKGFLNTVGWLYQSGVGASRQLARYNEIRTPDVAFAGQLVTIGVATVIAARRRANSPFAWIAPFAYLFAVSAAHVNGKFEVRGAAGRFVLATATDAVLLASYFAGRAVGAKSFLRRRSENARSGTGGTW
jgi:glycosyltransferase involved in cell wall biosynthesis